MRLGFPEIEDGGGGGGGGGTDGWLSALVVGKKQAAKEELPWCWDIFEKMINLRSSFFGRVFEEAMIYM